MTEPFQPIAHGAPEQPRRKRRIFLWVFMAVQVLFVLWVISGVASGSGTPADCAGLDQETCNAAADIGTGIGVALIFGVWVVVDLLLAIPYGIYRLAKRT